MVADVYELGDESGVVDLNGLSLLRLADGNHFQFLLVVLLVHFVQHVLARDFEELLFASLAGFRDALELPRLLLFGVHARLILLAHSLRVCQLLAHARLYCAHLVVINFAAETDRVLSLVLKFPLFLEL